MNTLKLFKRLRNSKDVEVFYKNSEDITYTIRLNYKNNVFTLHSYYVDGDDVFDEANYKDENITTYSEFDELLKTLFAKFPGIHLDI